ncbi:MAG TPA: hypothetical protein VMF61_03180 [Candidatus Acidoferrales bacterium]|nr:hypothetical protein [Candidatus Acidoferrales bacterium]
MAFGVAIALRYNSLPLLLPLLLFVGLWPFETRNELRARLYSLGLIGLALLGAYASLRWRLPDFQALPPPASFASIQEFDLIGMSVCSGVDLLPLAVTGGAPMDPQQIRQRYDARAADNSYNGRLASPPLVATDANGQVEALWRLSVPAHFGCYLAHRFAVFREVMGLNAQAVYASTTAGIDPNPYGIRLAFPGAAQWLITFVVTGASQLWRRPIILYALATIVTAVLWRRRQGCRLLALAMLIGSYLYVAALFFVAPTADARYTFPANVFCALIIVLGCAQLSTGVSYPAASSTCDSKNELAPAANGSG